ncbi:hypothetical protein ABPG77_007876 [Micractinium sp. CCAP 211/92]
MHSLALQSQLGQPSLRGPQAQQRRKRGAQPPAAFFQTLFRRAEPQQQLPGGLVEKPLYRPSEMVQMGPFKASPMGFGTWSWGNKLLWDYDESRDPELQEVFNLVTAAGINLFDTADSYGTGKLNGRSEQLLGRFIDEYPGSDAVRDNVRIATKLAAYPWRLTPQQWVGACRASLKRMGKERIALAQLHWSTANYAPLQERLMWDGLAAIYDEGLVEAVGLSNYGPRQLARIKQFLDKRGIPLAAVQVQYSLLSRGTDQAAVKAACDDMGIALIAYSPLALGMLTGKYSMDDPSSLPGGPRGLLFRQVLPGLQPLLQVMGEIAARRKKTLSQVVINWCICQGAVPIPGAKNLAQARENLGALGWRLSEGEVRALNEAADLVPRAMQQNVFQTR